MEVSHLLLETGNARSFIVDNKAFIDTVIPTDFITLFDELIKEGHQMEEMKILTNKVLNIFHVPLVNSQKTEIKNDSFLGILVQNNQEMEQVLNDIRPVFKAFVKDVNSSSLKAELLKLFIKLELFAQEDLRRSYSLYSSFLTYALYCRSNAQFLRFEFLCS